MIEHTCKFCGNKFEHTRMRIRACSKACRWKLWYREHEVYRKEYLRRRYE